jgi:ubiquinol-cytochrome c reductase cytochrome c1 subunit
MGKILLAALSAVLGLGIATAEAAGGVEIPSRDWSFSGPFGKFDQAARQRGGCHGLEYIAFRNLADLGYNEDEVKAIAAEFTVVDGPDDEGEMFEREGKPSDFWPAPFANDKAAAAANGGATPPELSLITKARKNGPNYVFGLLTGYEEPPADVELLEGLSYNKVFPGHQIAMAAPLFEDGVEYADGTPASVEQMAHDVVTFLAWTAEPEMEVRKQMGLKVMIFLVVFSIVLYAVKRKVWADQH